MSYFCLRTKLLPRHNNHTLVDSTAGDFRGNDVLLHFNAPIHRFVNQTVHPSSHPPSYLSPTPTHPSLHSPSTYQQLPPPTHPLLLHPKYYYTPPNPSLSRTHPPTHFCNHPYLPNLRKCGIPQIKSAHCKRACVLNPKYQPSSRTSIVAKRHELLRAVLESPQQAFAVYCLSPMTPVKAAFLPSHVVPHLQDCG